MTKATCNDAPRPAPRRGGRPWFTALVCAAVLATTVPTQAQVSPDELAHKHFDSGVAYLQESDYDSALKAFQRAYELSKRADILLNIATVHERMGKLQAAIDDLNEFLAQKPTGDMADTVKIRIANLQKRLDAEKDAGAEAAPDAGAATTLAPAPTASATAPPAATRKPPPPPPVPEEHASTLPAWILIGVGGLAAGGAAVTGVLANGKYNDAKNTCSPHCTDDQISSSKTLALSSTILTGVAVVGVGIGLTLLLTSGSTHEHAQAAALPQVLVGFGPRGAAANAAWSF